MRSYLPTVLGNEESRGRIGIGIESGTLPHALLLGGPRGSGKRTLALAIAAALNCERRTNTTAPLPCGLCNSCKRIAENNFTDLKVLKKAKDKATVGVGEVRDFREDMFLSATESEHKIYVIESAECLTPEAQNALLTVLEEPPPGVTIILLATECDKILTTVKSRVQFVPMTRFSGEQLEEYLTKISPEAAELRRTNPESFRGIIMSADGVLGEALRLTERGRAEENAQERKEVLEIMEAITKRMPYSVLYKALSSLPTKRQELISVLERLIGALCDLVLTKQSRAPHLTFYPSHEAARTAAAEIQLTRLMKIYGALISAHRHCTQNAGVASIVTNLALALHNA